MYRSLMLVVNMIQNEGCAIVQGMCFVCTMHTNYDWMAYQTYHSHANAAEADMEWFHFNRVRQL